MGFLIGALGAATVAFTAAPQAQGVSSDEVHSIAVDAYIYFYPLITMDLTRKQLTNVEAGKSEIGAPMNVLNNVQAFPSADMRAVVRPNFDTLYSSGWLDLTNEPVIISVPDTDGRYYLLPMLDMWSNVFASPGSRTTGTGAGNFIIARPDWNGVFPAGLTRINAPTPYVWVIGRTKTDGPSDYDAVHKIQAGYKDARQKIEEHQVTGESATIDNIYYLIVPEESRLELSNKLKEHLAIADTTG